MFTVRRRRKEEKRKDENKRQWPQCLDGRWGGRRPRDTVETKSNKAGGEREKERERGVRH